MNLSLNQMFLSLVLFPLIILLFPLILAKNVYVRARVCGIRREKDEHNNWKWALPYEEPCHCTRFVKFAGTHSCSSARSVKAFYADKPPASTDVAKVREHYGIRCNGKIQFVFCFLKDVLNYSTNSYVFIRIHFGEKLLRPQRLVAGFDTD